MTALELQAIPNNTELQNGITVLEQIPGLGVKISRVVAGCAAQVQFIHYNDRCAYAAWRKEPEKKLPFTSVSGIFHVKEEFVATSSVFRITTDGGQDMVLNMVFLPELIKTLEQLADYRKDEI